MPRSHWIKYSTKLLLPRIIPFKSFSAFRPKNIPKMAIILIVGTFFWTGTFLIVFRVLTYFKNIEELGTLLAFKLLSMILVTFFSLQIFSSVLTSLSTLFLSKDLNLIHSMPISSHSIFLARWMESFFDSSWMATLFTLPIFLSYGLIFEGGWSYYCVTALVLMTLSGSASLMSVILILTVVNIIPAHRIRSLFIFIGLSGFILIFLAFRLVKPERLVDPESFITVMTYLRTLKTPTSIYIPSTWAFDAIQSTLTGSDHLALLHLGLLITFSLFLFSLSIIISSKIYLKGYSKSQVVTSKLFRYHYNRQILDLFKGPTCTLMKKEVHFFFRDQSQWSQLFLIGALVVIYIYNFKVLPIEKSPIQTLYLKNLLSFLNVGLASFVLITITGRFSFPSVSIEGEAFWIVKSSPLTMRQFLWAKFFIYFIPLLFISEVLIVVTNLLLGVSNVMMIISVTTMVFIVPGVVGMGVGMGAVYADFKSENPSQALSSYGGLLFMLLSAIHVVLVLVLEAGPVYEIIMAGINGMALSEEKWIWIILSFLVCLIICLAAIALPMLLGEKHLKWRQA